MDNKYLASRKHELTKLISDYCDKHRLDVSVHSVTIYENDLTLLLKAHDKSKNISKIQDIRSKKDILKSRLGLTDSEADICVSGLHNTANSRTYMFMEYKKRNHKYPYIFVTATGDYYKLSSSYVKTLLSRR
jgi:hypothetical protein